MGGVGSHFVSRLNLQAMAIRGIFPAEEITEAHMAGCRAPSLRSRAQSMRRSRSDSSLAGLYECRDEVCNYVLGPLDCLFWPSAHNRFMHADDEFTDRICPCCGTTISMFSRVIHALITIDPWRHPRFERGLSSTANTATIDSQYAGHRF